MNRTLPGQPLAARLRPARHRATVSAVTALLLAGSAQASLIARANGMVYDSTLNITWLSDMNFAGTSGQGTDGHGQMSWYQAQAWAGELNFGGVSGWRLPTLNPSDASCSDQTSVPGYALQHYGFGCTGGELSHLFVVDLGIRPYNYVLDFGYHTAEQIANVGLFSNWTNVTQIWSATEYAPNSFEAWVFAINRGDQFATQKPTGGYAVAVHAGDVANSVPEPQSLALALLALGAGALSRKRRAR